MNRFEQWGEGVPIMNAGSLLTRIRGLGPFSKTHFKEINALA